MADDDLQLAAIVEELRAIHEALDTLIGRTAGRCCLRSSRSARATDRPKVGCRA